MKLINLEFKTNSILRLKIETEEQINELIRCFKKQEIIETPIKNGDMCVIDFRNVNYILIDEVEE